MDDLSLLAETGRPTGSSAAKRLRAQGKVPAIVYGLGLTPVAVAVGARELRAALSTDAGTNALIRLKVDGDEHVTLAREIQKNPVRHSVTHVDFVLVNLDEDVHVDVPIHLEGDAEQVHRESGTIEQVIFVLPVICKPTNIPSGLTYDVSNMVVGDTVKVSDLALPEGVMTELDPDEPVATAQVTRATIEAEEEAAAIEEAAAEAAEGEEGAEGEGGAEGGEGASEGGGGEASGGESSEGESS